MVSATRPMLPDLGVRPPADGRPHVLIIERISPGSPEMVYAPIGWWQQLSTCAVSVVNVWPLETIGGIPSSIDLDDFDAVVVFPRIAYDPVALHFLDRRLRTSFADYDGVKVLMRQDENVMTRSIEDFVIDNGFDVLITCVPEEQVTAAYPRLGGHPVTVLPVLTGYVSPDMRQVPRAQYEQRSIDLSYRAYRGSVGSGRLVHEKAAIGEKALDRFADSGLNLDISLDPKDRLVGSDWREFLNDSKAVLGTESGSNLFDFDGEVNRWAALFSREHEGSGLGPDELFELSQEHLDRFEGNVQYAQVSPRHFEAAAFGALQVMFPGRYSGIFQAGRHFVELRKDFSNLDEVVAAIRDRSLHSEITQRAVDEVINNRDLWIETAMGRLDSAVNELIESRPRTTGAIRRSSSEAGDPGAHTSQGQRSPRALHIVGDAADGIPHPLAGIAAGTPPILLATNEADRTEVTDTADLTTVSIGPGSSTPVSGFDRLASPILAPTFDRLSRTAHASPGEIVHRFGGYADRFGSPDEFRKNCRRALELADEALTWTGRGLEPRVVLVSDAIGLLAAGVSSTLTMTPLVVDYETIAASLQTTHGWQSTFWENLAREIVASSSIAVVVSSSASSLTAARSLFGHDRVVESVALEEYLSNAMLSSSPEPETVRLENFDWIFAGLRSNDATPSLHDLCTNVLPFVERTFGVESIRFWNILREAAEDFRRGGHFDDAKALLHHGLSRYVNAAESDSTGPVLRDLLELRRSLVIRLFATSQSEFSDDEAKALAERVVGGDVPISSDNRRPMWALAVRLRPTEHRQLHDELVHLLNATAVDNADRLYGLLNLLAHDWSITDYASARPVAVELQELAASDDAIDLTDSVMARIRVILDAPDRRAST